MTTIENPWIVTRTLESAEGSIEIKIGQPEMVIDDEWRCIYQVADKTSYAHGLDALQSLIMALTGVRRALDHRSSPLKWRGGKTGDHGVPQMVPQAFGVAFSRRIEELIDSEVNLFAAQAENAAKAKASR